MFPVSLNSDQENTRLFKDLCGKKLYGSPIFLMARLAPQIPNDVQRSIRPPSRISNAFQGSLQLGGLQETDVIISDTCARQNNRTWNCHYNTYDLLLLINLSTFFYVTL